MSNTTVSAYRRNLSPQGERSPTVAVLIPCYNEAVAIGKVVADFRAAVPDATIYVYDNNSTDGTIEQAQAAGAVVRLETQQGKGHVVRRMFADVEADIYLLVDGDDTYDAAAAPDMVRMLLEQQLDMVVATRVTDEQAAYRMAPVRRRHVHRHRPQRVRQADQ
jgi:glycosyltransferase involved in cell wall biosynthesis